MSRALDVPGVLDPEFWMYSLVLSSSDDLNLMMMMISIVLLSSLGSSLLSSWRVFSKG